MHIFHITVLYGFVTFQVSVSTARLGVLVSISGRGVLWPVAQHYLYIQILIFLNPQEKYLSHQSSGNKFLSLRNQIRVFNDIEIKNSNYIDEYTKRLIEFSKERNSLNKNSLAIAETGYKNVKKQIEEETHIYEIDKNKSCR